MKKLYLAFLLSQLICTTWAQDNFRLDGIVTDIHKNPIQHAHIHVLNTFIGTTTDKTGRFSLSNISQGNSLQVTAVGYASITISVIQSDNPIEIILAESSTQLDQVVVTAQKLEEDLQTIPISITNLSAPQINNYRLWETNALTALSPGLYSSHSGDGRNVTSIRGITSTSYDPAVATYIDGVNQFGLDTYIAQLVNIDRIEVLRGPQGTLYGRNAMGGVINIITKQPSNNISGFAEISVGGYNQRRFIANLNTPIVKDKLFLGASLLLNQLDGFYTNTYTSHSFDRQKNILGNYYLKYLINPKWQIILNFKHNANRNDGAFPLAGSPEEALKNPFTVNQNDRTTLIDNILNTSLNLKYAGSKLNFNSQTSYQTNYRIYDTSIDADFSPLDIVSIYNNYGKSWNNVKVFIQEFRINSTHNTSPFQWTTGAYFFYQNSPVKQATEFGEDAAYFEAEPNTAFINTSKSVNRGMAFYGQASYRFNPWELTLGMRYDHETRDLQILGEYSFDPASDPIIVQPDTSGTTSFQALSPKATLGYYFKNSMAYFVYSRGYRTGGFTPLSADPSQPPLVGYKPEYSNNLEIGSKSTLLNGRLFINLSAFYVTVNDVQIPTLILPDAITITQNAGRLTSYGLEIESSTTVTKGLTLQYNGGLNHARYTQLKLATNNEITDYKDNHQIFTPSITSLTALQYEWDLGSTKIIPRLEWIYLGEHYFDLANTIRQSPYSLINTKLTWESENFSIAIWFRNLTNVNYIAYAYDFGATHLGNPRQLGVTCRYKF